jgi:valyl-tRNA synthetase
MGERHDLPRVAVMDQNGTMNDNAGPYAGLDRFEARKRIVERLDKEGLLERVTDYTYPIGKCYRCETVVEPYLSKQYFVRMKPLAEPAIDVVKRGQIRFHPDKWTKVYFNWMEGIRDWCISRQLWWGHRIPVWHCQRCDAMTSEMEDPSSCPSCGGEVRREEDVLDTWFSSWLWPFSTLGWPDSTEDLQRYYPTSVLVTGPDIIFFWVARMIMAGLHFMEEIPFRDVYLHGLIRDEFGRKMSKSLGNSPDPSDLIATYGADALRFTVISLTPKGSDILFAERHVETGRNFANKVWNAVRLVSNAAEDMKADTVSPDGLEVCDRWILSRTACAARQVGTYFDDFLLNQAAKAVYDFIWHEVCDWYLELAKERFYSEHEARRAGAVALARDVLRRSLQLLHPFMPFLSEELWSKLEPGGHSLLEAGMSPSDDLPRDTDAENVMEIVIAIVEAIRNIRGEMSIHPSVGVPVYLDFHDGRELADSVMEARAYIIKMGKVSDLKIGKAPSDLGPVATGIAGTVEVGLPLGDVIDVRVEKARLRKEIDRVEVLLSRSTSKLGNAEFLQRAPAAVVEREREKVGQLELNLSKLRKSLSVLGD